MGKKILEQEVSYIRDYLAGCKRVLDIGCGPGIFERELLGMDIVGVDSSQGMLDEAKKIAKNQFLLARAEELPFPEASFDGVFFVTSLEFLQDYKRALSEVYRVLCGGGKMIALILNPESNYFKERIKKGGYIKENIKHADLRAIRECAEGKFDLAEEYFLGIKDGKITDSKDPKIASLYVIRGIKR
ncbi:MAG: class I SAM-dependent methyltransferase [Candidatus Altiarchaeota archaeon]|nr:class I SAM-dependent methyltransferase [Candidatus Altiarchaeota archaeon]